METSNSTYTFMYCLECKQTGEVTLEKELDVVEKHFFLILEALGNPMRQCWFSVVICQHSAKKRRNFHNCGYRNEMRERVI